MAFQSLHLIGIYYFLRQKSFWSWKTNTVQWTVYDFYPLHYPRVLKLYDHIVIMMGGSNGSGGRAGLTTSQKVSSSIPCSSCMSKCLWTRLGINSILLPLVLECVWIAESENPVGHFRQERLYHSMCAGFQWYSMSKEIGVQMFFHCCTQHPYHSIK